MGLTMNKEESLGKEFDRFGFDKEGYNKQGFNRLGYNRFGYDKDGYDINGFNKNGINKLTGRDREGYDSEGYGIDGFDREGFDRLGYDRDGYNRNGFNSDGFNREGYNYNGFSKDGYDREGYDEKGYNKLGYNRKGFDKKGYDKEGYDEDGFNLDGIDREGYDRKGFKDGIDRDGFDRLGFDSEGYNRKGFNQEGYDREGYDKWGLNKSKITRDGFDIFGFGPDGYNILGFDRLGFDRRQKSLDGFSKDMFDEDGYHIFTGYNTKGFNRDGYNINGYDKDGYDEEGYHFITGLNKYGYNREGFNVKGYNQKGFDINGYDINGYDKDGYDKDGFDNENFDRNGFDRNGFDKDGYDINGYNKDGDLNPKLQQEIALDQENKENLLEEQYFKKCQAQIKGYYRDRIRKKKLENYKPVERRYIDRWGLVHTEVDYPDMGLLDIEVSKAINPILNEPYFGHVNYAGNPELYIGKVSITGWVIDWADERSKYWYQYQIFVGDKNVNLEYVRGISVLSGKYLGYKTLFANTTQNNDDVMQVADERLRQIIRANRNNKKVHDIVESIQRNQYKIITNDNNKSIIVLGCAGSGKTMILMHKIRYAKYNNKKLNMDDFIVISPTDILGRESRQLSRLLQINKVRQYTTASFYKYAISEYLVNNDIFHEKIKVFDDGNVILSNYDKYLLDEYCVRVDEILQYSSKEAKAFLDNEYNKLTEIMSEYYRRLKKDRDYFISTRKVYDKAIKEVSQLNKKSLRALLPLIDKELKKIDNIKNYKAVMERMLLLPDIREKARTKRKEEENIALKYLVTRRMVDLLDFESFYRVVIDQDIRPKNLTELFLILQCFSEKPLVDREAENVLQEWTNTSKEELLEYINFIDDECGRLDRLREKKTLFERFIESDYILDKGVEAKDLNPNEVFDNVLELAQRTDELFDNGIFDAFDFFDAYNRVSNKRSRVSSQRGTNRNYQYMFDVILSILGIEEKTDMTVEISVSQAFAALYILCKKFGSIDRNKLFIFIDEFQDFSPIELLTIKRIYPLGVFNLFGDFNQCINEKGIRKIDYVPKGMYEQKPYNINENYRNATQIAQYVNKRFRVGMNPVGLEGRVNEVEKLKSYTIDEDDRVALIVKKTPTNIANKEIFNDYMVTKEIKRGFINIIPVCMVKGLEFEKVFVARKDLTENEFYVSCTRAISELVVINNFQEKDLDSFSLQV